jgi:hypothetical protein
MLGQYDLNLHRGLAMNRKMVCVAITAWMLWQETLLPNTLGLPSWQLDSEFSGESACGETRMIRILDQILRAGNDGTTIINQPTIQEGTVWREQPNGDRTRIRFFCLPETIDPRDSWSSIPSCLSRVEMHNNRSWPSPTRTSFV